LDARTSSGIPSGGAIFHGCPAHPLRLAAAPAKRRSHRPFDKYIVIRYLSRVPVQRMSDAEYRLLAEFRHQLRKFLAFSEDQARAVGLKPQQHQLLLAIRAAAPEPPNIKTLAERLVIKHHSAVELVDRLERAKLVWRERSQTDRRRAKVQLTPRGERILLRLTVRHRAELRRAGPLLMQALRKLSRGTTNSLGTKVR
jgi:DNA-binding MarR family transcriptional regulator